MSITINPPPDGPWTVADLDSLPDTGYRFEIHEGDLLMMSPVTVWHSFTAERLAQALRARGLVAYLEVGIKRTDRSTRITDVGVFHKPPETRRQAMWPPEDLRIVIEIVSDSSQEEDRVVKPRWYASAGIPEFWRVEESDDDEAVIYQHKLAHTADGDAAYIQTGVTTLVILEAEAASATRE